MSIIHDWQLSPASVTTVGGCACGNPGCVFCGVVRIGDPQPVPHIYPQVPAQSFPTQRHDLILRAFGEILRARPELTAAQAMEDAKSAVAAMLGEVGA